MKLRMGLIGLYDRHIQAKKNRKSKGVTIWSCTRVNQGPQKGGDSWGNAIHRSYTGVVRGVQDSRKKVGIAGFRVKRFRLTGRQCFDRINRIGFARLQRAACAGVRGGLGPGVAVAGPGRGSRPQLDGCQPHRGSGRKNDRALEDVFEFADLARPVISG
jgi:hypothetical protein